MKYAHQDLCPLHLYAAGTGYIDARTHPVLKYLSRVEIRDPRNCAVGLNFYIIKYLLSRVLLRWRFKAESI